MNPALPPRLVKRINWPGFAGGTVGILLSLGAGVIVASIAALAFGFEATKAGYGAVGLGVLTCVGVVCGGLAVQGSFKGRPVFPLIAGSIISAVMALLACMTLILR